MQTFEDVLSCFHDFLEESSYLEVLPCRWGYVRLFDEGDPINFSAVLYISDRYMRNLERGERVPSIDLFVELRERFGSSLDYIVLGITASEREQAMQEQLQETRKALKEMQNHIQKMLELLGEPA